MFKTRAHAFTSTTMIIDITWDDRLQIVSSPTTNIKDLLKHYILAFKHVRGRIPSKEELLLVRPTLLVK